MRPAPVDARPLGEPRPPRRRFVAPAAVRLAQVCLALRIAMVVGLLLSAGFTAPATRLVIPDWSTITLPGGGLWNALAVWVLLGSTFETVLVLRLGTLRAGSRRVVLLVESAVIAGTGVYAAAGLKAALIPMVASIAAVVLLRLDYVRHSFNRAQAERRLVGRPITSVLYSGYAFEDPVRAARPQEVGYRVGVDCPAPGEARRSRSSAYPTAGSTWPAAEKVPSAKRTQPRAS